MTGNINSSGSLDELPMDGRDTPENEVRESYLRSLSLFSLTEYPFHLATFIPCWIRVIAEGGR
jgi:hypothetical protein